MKVRRSHLMSLVLAIFTITTLLTIPTASAISRCGTFETVPMPGIAARVAALNDGTAWAVGSSESDPLNPAIYFFDGGAWSEYSVPGEINGFVFGASGNTPDGDAWFAGTRAYSVYEIEVVFMRMRGGVIDRIDSFLYPSSINTPGAPVDISASSADDVWALTASGDVLRFDGSSWQTIDVPQPFSPQRSIHPAGIYVAGPDDVWTAGSGGPGRADYFGYTQHWDGSNWSIVSTPVDGQDLTFFRDIDGSGQDDIWISGHWNYSEDILLYWDGSAWTQSQGPASDAPMDEVLAMEPGNAWSFPYSLTSGNTFYYWNGSAWGEGTNLEIPNANTINWQDVSKGSTCDAWAVGFYHDPDRVRHPLAARLVPGDVQPEMAVSAIDISRVRASGKSYYGTASVTVLDGDQAPVSGADVNGVFSGPTGESLSAVTGADGRATFSSEIVSRPSGDWCLTVTAITAATAVYNPALNVETSDCEAAGDGGNGGKGGGKRR